MEQQPQNPDTRQQQDDKVTQAEKGFLDAWTDRYRGTVVGRMLSFFGFGSKK